MHINKTIKLAIIFDKLIKKIAEEADSSAISNFIIGTVSESINSFNLQNKLADALVKKRDEEWNKGNEIYGDIVIGNRGGFINATKDAQRGWVITNVALSIDGSLLENNIMKPIILKVYNSFIETLKPRIKTALDNYSQKDPGWKNYTKISNYEMPHNSFKVYVEL